MERRRNFSRDFKLSVLRELENGKSVAELCRENEIHPALLSRWRREFRDNPREAFSGHGNTYKLEAKLAERERLIGQLYAENALLKIRTFPPVYRLVVKSAVRKFGITAKFAAITL